MSNFLNNPTIRALRPNQWIKNLVLFTAIIFTGELFNPYYFWMTTIGFFIFCALSSSSYLFNDIIDLKFDRLHPLKKNRPLASGVLPVNRAAEMAFLLGFFGLIAALIISLSFFGVSLLFILLHIFYSLLFKKHAVFDIFGISLSFIFRAYAGEVLTGFHLPFWLFLTILFVALFVAATKRHAELLRQGEKTRPALFQYRDKLLDSYTSMFGSASIIAYSLFTFLEEPPKFSTPFKQFLIDVFPGAIDRKWMVVTIPFIIFGLMRYAQLAYEGKEAEQPEKIVTTDIPLIVAILVWGLTVISILYIL
ncbi:hypothetical protein A2153_00340 [Candidatus Gottesmanbacteria bacterium RBG_16_38_7b]|uniref:Phosphoribose diphosphate--decaprenyl-phosphate phosphoribosyltransferase n=2 Tax=Candidatus Gottesmaniibacteriota TaxID=1752720 RepID=A0A1F5YKW4_9BACT|nr:MAG: hypothetical protein A2153_00340 [Candidatus Gottesmanbacteria bacterium RBG_16_38_7b]OGG32100.1 MAG: hypothetical protein A3I51_01575 [Candidatus Gottesmanbacteria bacterium RIFCSPLOWO2_02_FULL_38_8]